MVNRKRISGYIATPTSGNELFRIRFQEIDKNHVIKVSRFEIGITKKLDAAFVVLKDIPANAFSDLTNIQVSEFLPYVRTDQKQELYDNKYIMLQLKGDVGDNMQIIDVIDKVDVKHKYVYDSIWFYLEANDTYLHYFIIEYDVLIEQNVMAQALMISDAIDVIRESTHMEYSKSSGEHVAPGDLPL